MANWWKNNYNHVITWAIVISCVVVEVVDLCHGNDRDTNIDAKQKEVKSQVDSVANLVQDVEAGVQENARAIQQVGAKVDAVQQTVDTCCCEKCQKTSGNRQQKPAKPVVIRDTVRDTIWVGKQPCPCEGIPARTIEFECLVGPKVR